MRFDYEDTSSEAFKALPSDAIIHLPPPTWTRPFRPSIVKIPPHWLAFATQQLVRPSTEMTPSQVWHNMKKNKDQKSTQGSTSQELFSKQSKDPSQEVEPPKVQFEKKVHL